MVDDDAPIRKLMATHLRGLGCRSATAKDGKEGQERARLEGRAQMVLSKGDGGSLELVKRLQAMLARDP